MATKTKTVKPQFTYHAIVQEISDADTLKCIVDIGFRIEVKVILRLKGINAPELSTPEGKKARDYVKKKLPEGFPIVIKTYKDPTDKYGRWLSDVFLGELHLNQHLVEQGFAKPYLD